MSRRLPDPDASRLLGGHARRLWRVERRIIPRPGVSAGEPGEPPPVSPVQVARFVYGTTDVWLPGVNLDNTGAGWVQVFDPDGIADTAAAPTDWGVQLNEVGVYQVLVNVAGNNSDSGAVFTLVMGSSDGGTFAVGPYPTRGFEWIGQIAGTFVATNPPTELYVYLSFGNQVTDPVQLLEANMDITRVYPASPL